MANNKALARETAVSYFTRRAREYNHSANWVDDAVLIGKMRDLAGVGPETHILDIAIGTGKVAEAFYGRAKYVVGLDICKEMVRQAKGCADKIVLASAEALPFKNDVFDACICRQGLQFMDLDGALTEIYRVLKPGGRIVLCHLTAYGPDDKDETFAIQRLRNPARKNFFLPDDFLRLLENKAFTGIEFIEYFTRESINQWIDNCAISIDARTKIREIYKNSSDVFKKIHNIKFENGDILDTMKMLLVKAKKMRRK